MKIRATLLAFVTMMSVSAAEAAPNKVVVLELFTSQGCSSCPPADALLRRLSASDATILPLSFHVDYWDHLGWKDPFSSRENTDRQKAYRISLGESQIYTPQLVVNGAQSMVGSQETIVQQALTKARAENQTVDVAINSGADGQLNVVVTPHNNPGDAEILEVRYSRHAMTEVANGENGGRKLENINNVISLRHIGDIDNNSVTFALAKPDLTQEGVAIIIQQKNLGAIVGAAYTQS